MRVMSWTINTETKEFNTLTISNFFEFKLQTRSFSPSKSGSTTTFESNRTPE